MPYIPQQYHPTYPPPNARGSTLTSHLQSEHADHNALPHFHDAYYHGMIGGNDLYHSSLPAPALYPFYPPHPTLAHAGCISCPEGNENSLPATQRPQNDSRGNKEVHVKDAT